MTNFSNLFASGPFACGLSDIYEVEGIVIFGQICMLIDRLLKKAAGRLVELLSIEKAAKRRGEHWSRDPGTLLWELDRITKGIDLLAENSGGRVAVQIALALKLE